MTYVPAAQRIPAASLSFAQYVDHLCRSLLGRESTSRQLQAASAATGLRPDARITRKHALAGWMFPHVASVLLDSPEHMCR